MKIFIAGARSVTTLDEFVQGKMLSIYQKGHDVLIGDCYGVDASVQRFYAGLGYDRVTVFASNGRARNNIGHWRIEKVEAPRSLHGFDFYRQKDIAMADEAEYGFMIWDGESRGTLTNVVTLVTQGKQTLVYIPSHQRVMVVKDIDDIRALVEPCAAKTKTLCAHMIDEVLRKKQPQLAMEI